MNEKPFNELQLAIVGPSESAQFAEQIRQRGGEPSTFDFPTTTSRIQEVIPEFANKILTAHYETSLFVTGIGVRRIIEFAAQSVPRDRFIHCLQDSKTVAGSPLAADALAEFGIQPTISIPAGNSWREILIAMDRNLRIANQPIAVEESFDIHSLANGLEVRGARVDRIPAFDVGETTTPQLALSFFEQIEADDFHGVLFFDAASAAQFCRLARQFGRGRFSGHLLDNHFVLAIGNDTAEVLRDRGFLVDFEVQRRDDSGDWIAESVEQLSQQIGFIRKQKAIIRTRISGPTSSNSDPNAPWYDSPFMKACRGEPTSVTPIWMMRQAGRYMQEYRAVRDKVSFLELCANPQLCSEVMCTAVNRLGVDAAIIFSDLLPILVPMGCDLEFVKGDGPVIHNPVRSAHDLDRIKPLESNEPLEFVMETVRQTRNDLPADLPLIGFAGAPFTLASYMIEGGASRNYAATKKLMFGDHGAWKQLMEYLSDSISLYLNGQIEAGAQCVQLFDSWAGCLSFEDYRLHVHPYVKRIIASLPSNVPVINFATGNPSLLPLLADTRAAIVGVDWRTRLDDAWQIVGYERGVQGNLDPTVLLTNPEEIRRQAKFVLDQAAGRAGHIFNLGHGILPMTPVENAIALVDAVHELSQS